jgi:hypothetical protein
MSYLNVQIIHRIETNETIFKGEHMSRAILMMFLAGLATACTKSSKPITLSTGNQGLIATCDGKSLNWNYCYDIAAKACPSGYEVSDKSENDFSGKVQDLRSLYFKCK